MLAFMEVRLLLLVNYLEFLYFAIVGIEDKEFWIIKKCLYLQALGERLTLMTSGGQKTLYQTSRPCKT